MLFHISLSAFQSWRIFSNFLSINLALTCNHMFCTESRYIDYSYETFHRKIFAVQILFSCVNYMPWIICRECCSIMWLKKCLLAFIYTKLLSKLVSKYFCNIFRHSFVLMDFFHCTGILNLNTENNSTIL